MTDLEAHRLREEFFESLDESMTALPYRVATDIRQGIAEELEGLDAHETAARLAKLGSPESIAREAAASVHERAAEEPRVAALTKPKGFESSKAFAIAAALVYSFGGFVVPLVGFIVGAVLVLTSRLWQRWEKLLALLVPLVVVLALFGVAWIARVAQQDSSLGDARNPLVPAAYDIWHSTILLGLILFPVCGMWLLWRLRGRTR